MSKDRTAAQNTRKSGKKPPNAEAAHATANQQNEIPTAESLGITYTVEDAADFARNMLRVGTQARRLVGDFFSRQNARGESGFDPLNLTGAFTALVKGVATNPAPVLQAQFKLWQEFMGLWETNARRMLGGDVAPAIKPLPGDRRFKDAEWEKNQVFSFIKDSYLLTANWLQTTVSDIEGIDVDTKKRIAFFTRQFADAMAPTNFVLTNPEVLRETVNTKGENLVRGLNNLLEDIERGHGKLSIRQSAESFKIGENIATAPGKVVFRNELLELLQFEPTTSEVYERPLLIFPPWINKYYIMDLRPENSLIRWLSGQGYTVFVVSWVNPDAHLAQKNFDDYMRQGVFEALDAVEAATGVKDPNAVGYCIGGTLLSISLAYMAQKGQQRINAATFYAAQNDFTDAGDLKVFIDDQQLDSLKHTMDAAGGVLEGRSMATTFNMLRANDLIWSFVVNNYLMGREPVPFDLLYWNSDATRMPEALHLFYLRRCYKDNALAKGELEVGGLKIDLGNVTIPVYLQSAKEDHISPYRSVYRSTKLFKGPVRFIVAGSGHIAGVINPPSAHKYQYWTNEAATSKYPDKVEDWFAGAFEHKGSWWPDWDHWLSQRSGPKVPARRPGDGKLKVLEDAPGTYVLLKAQ